MSSKPTCSSCAAFHGIDSTCHLNPPAVTICIVPNMKTESFSPATFCAFPTTQRHEWCSQHIEASRVITLNS